MTLAAVTTALLALAFSAVIQKDANKAADAFQLDLGSVPEDEAIARPAGTKQEPAPEPAAVPEPEAAVPAPAAAVGGTTSFTLDTPIDRLIADPRARAVLDRNLPGLSGDENLPKFRALSLRQFQPLTGGQLTGALLSKVEADLAKIAPAPVKKRRFEGR